MLKVFRVYVEKFLVKPHENMRKAGYRSVNFLTNIRHNSDCAVKNGSTIELELVVFCPSKILSKELGHKTNRVRIRVRKNIQIQNVFVFDIFTIQSHYDGISVLFSTLTLKITFHSKNVSQSKLWFCVNLA